MELNALNEAKRVWQLVSKEKPEEEINFEIELRKKLLHFFQIGDFYYYIFNLSTLEVELFSEGVQRVLGYDPTIVNLFFFFNKIHPDDQPWYVNFEKEARDFLSSLPVEKIAKYKIRMDFRVQKEDGNYIRILHQAMALQQYEDGGVYRTLGLHSDITHIKPNGKPMLSFIGMDGETSFIDVQPGKLVMPIPEPLSKREKEILLHIMDGKQNKEIAEILNISKLTVDRHRKNMLTNNNLNSSGELIAKAIKNGWI
jgi:DNA-binding CsgD family transcriptional regulator